jgi:hypothetical protein
MLYMSKMIELVLQCALSNNELDDFVEYVGTRTYYDHTHKTEREKSYVH